MPSWLDSPEILNVVFHPRKEDVYGDDTHVLDIPVDGVTLGARFYQAGPDKPTLLFFHGNGEIVADYDGLAPAYTAGGANFLPVDYRGYGRSAGQPSISSMLADARKVFRYVVAWLAEQDYRQDLIVMGRSLGSAPALELAQVFGEVAGLIIESGFADVRGLLARLGARLPAGMPDENVLRQEQKIAAYRGPTLIIHGVADTIIPVQDAHTLFAACPSDAKRLVTIERAGHNTLLAVGRAEYMQAVRDMVLAAG